METDEQIEPICAEKTEPSGDFPSSGSADPVADPVKPKAPEVEVHLFRKGRGPVDVFRSKLGGWDQDRLEVQDILDKYGFKSVFAFNPSSGRGVSIRFNPRNGRSFLPYLDEAVIFVDGEPKVAPFVDLSEFLDSSISEASFRRIAQSSPGAGFAGEADHKDSVRSGGDNSPGGVSREGQSVAGILELRWVELPPLDPRLRGRGLHETPEENEELPPGARLVDVDHHLTGIGVRNSRNQINASRKREAAMV